MEEKLVNPIDSAIDFFEILNKEEFRSENIYLEFSKLWKNPPSNELKERIKRWSTSGKRLESLFTLISYHFLDEINKEREENKNDN